MQMLLKNILDSSYLIRNPNVYIFELLFSIIIAFITFYFSQNIKPKYSLLIFFSSMISVIFNWFRFLFVTLGTYRF